ncbi:MAG: hypothetical protein RL026_689 [Pseudomonadota bacterium]|jgi:peroxiredoxin
MTARLRPLLGLVPLLSASVMASAPDFALRGLDGTTRRLSELHGDVVMLAFGGSGCGRCREQQVVLARLQSTYATAGLAVWVIDDAVEVRPALPGVTVLRDAGGEVARRYRVRREPTLLLLDRRGTLRAVFEDFREADQMAYLARLKPLLDE